jgi:hypothetical protein
MNTAELLNVAKANHYEVKEIDGSFFVLLPAWQVDTFAYFPNSRKYAYNYQAKMEPSSDGTMCYLVPLSYLELDRSYIPD